MVVGVVAGVLAFGFATLFGEPQVDKAIAFESAHTAGGYGAELVSRTVQSTFGLGVVVFVYGAALGGIFALAFAFAYGRVGRFDARSTALLVAAVGFVAMELVPFLKYPANPPAIGLSVAAAIGATLLGRSLVPRLGSWDAVLVALGAFVAAVAVVAVLLPGINEVPGDFPATTLWRFRLASLGTQLVLWATFGLLFGALTERGLRRSRHPVPPGAVAR
jgi:hypothetical protein